jgi:NAD(P)-dependent dehydrogenase (short-subunit alcohol dehydrogenase family)
MTDWTTKTVIVTGAAAGIGERIAEMFVGLGSQVIVTDIRDQEGQRVATKLGSLATYQHLDVRKVQDWQTVASKLKTPWNVLVNNAGITGFSEGYFPQDPEHCTLDHWRAVHHTNLDGVFLGCQTAIQHMKTTGGTIVNIASRSGLVGVPAASAYASSKAAVRNHTKSVALYCAAQRYPIRCNAVLPAAILTAMWEPMLGQGPERERNMQSLVADTPLQRFGTTTEVAHAVMFLASDESSYMTGGELMLDGGLLAGSASPPAPKSIDLTHL